MSSSKRGKKKWFELIGILAVIGIVGAIIMAKGYQIFSGAVKVLLRIVMLVVFAFAMKGCMM